MNTRGDGFEKKNDSGIGRALAWAVAALVLVASATIFLVVKNSPAHPHTDAADQGPTAPAVIFRNITAEAGITFRHYNGATGEKLLPETMGAGCAFFDFDGDADQDLLLVNGTDWGWSRDPSSARHTTELYRNNGRGIFESVTAGSGLEVELYGMGVAIGDYDNDGLPDLFLTAVGGNRLFHNAGDGRFKDVSIAMGLPDGKDEWSTSAAWFDFDNDSDLDLFVCNYVAWAPETDFSVNYQLAGLGRAYGPPLGFPGSTSRLYRNEGGKALTDVTEASGIKMVNKATGELLAKSLGVAPVDLDGDHWIDLIVANDTVQNFVFHNERNGKFKEVGALSGAAFDSFGKARGAMGIDAARFQDDDSVAVSIGNFANEMTAFYVAPPKALTFTDEALARGIGSATRHLLTFGVFFFDYDLDGSLDLLTTNGHLEEQISKAQPAQQYRQPAQLFWNTRGVGEKTGFAAVPVASTGDLATPIAGRGSAFADIDGDGDLDVLLTEVAGAPLLLRNEQKLGHHWVRIKLVGTRCNRDAIGAWIKVRAGGRTAYRQVMPARGYLSQSELPVTIGLGSGTKIDEISVIWPGGEVQRIQPPPLDSMATIRQPEKADASG